MKNHNDILNKLAIRTITYFDENLNLNIQNEFTIKNVSKIDYLDISTHISLSNDIIGTAGMSISNELAYKMVKNFVFGDLTKDELISLSSENLAETLNIILGNILQDLEIIKNGGKVEITTPNTKQEKVTITNENDTMYLCELKLDNEIILLSYFE